MSNLLGWLLVLELLWTPFSQAFFISIAEVATLSRHIIRLPGASSSDQQSRTHTYYWPGKRLPHAEHNIIRWIFKNHQIIPLFMAGFIYYSVWSIPTTFPFYSNSNEKKNSCHVAHNNGWLKYLSIVVLNIYIRSFMDLCSFEDISFIFLLHWILLGKKIMNEPKNLGLMLFKIYMWEVELFPVSLFVLSWFYATFEIYNSSSWGAHWWMSLVGKRGGGCCWVEKEGAPRNNFFWSGFWLKILIGEVLVEKNYHDYILVGTFM